MRALTIFAGLGGADLQGLPPDYPIDAAGTKSAAYTAVGNAVVPAVAEALARSILTSTLTPPTPPEHP